MSDSLNIEKMIREKKIVVPDYQRAYIIRKTKCTKN